MDINDELVNKLATLSRLSFNAAEKESIKADLSKMISFVEKLNEVDTKGVEPLLHITTNTNVMREDEVVQTLTREETLKNAAMKDEQFFKVPKVIQK